MCAKFHSRTIWLRLVLAIRTVENDAGTKLHWVSIHSFNTNGYIRVAMLK